MTLGLKDGAKIDSSNEKYRESFETLKKIMMSNIVLKYPNFDKPFTLTTDAINVALGAVLSQSNGPICFASRTLNAHELNYATYEKELLAIVWATKQFRHYLYGKKFIVKTDHRALGWLSNFKDPNQKLQRWKIKLGEYDFDIEYVKGKGNVVADALSRIKIESEQFLNPNKIEFSNKKLKIKEKECSKTESFDELEEMNVSEIDFQPELNTFEFNVCKKVLVNRKKLNKHKLDVHESKPQTCIICQKKLKNKTVLNEHRTH